MKNYYFNPQNRDLIIYDTDAQDVQIVERIEKVRVWVKGEVRLGDFDGENPNDTPERAFASRGLYTNHNLPKKSAASKEKPAPKESDGKMHCKNCGEPGHFAKTCKAPRKE